MIIFHQQDTTTANAAQPLKALFLKDHSPSATLPGTENALLPSQSARTRLGWLQTGKVLGGYRECFGGRGFQPHGHAIVEQPTSMKKDGHVS